MIKITKEQIGKIIKEAIAADREELTYGDKLKEIDPLDIDATALKMKEMKPEELRQNLEVYASIHPKLREEGPARDAFLNFADNPDSIRDVYSSAIAGNQDDTKTV